MYNINIEILNKYGVSPYVSFYDSWKDELTESQIKKLYCHTFLQQTDHIPNKIIEKFIEDLAEATLLNILEVIFSFISAIKVEYKEVLHYRKQARQEIDALETAGANAAE